jgi:hypothetical protein
MPLAECISAQMNTPTSKRLFERAEELAPRRR